LGSRISEQAERAQGSLEAGETAADLLGLGLLLSPAGFPLGLLLGSLLVSKLLDVLADLLRVGHVRGAAGAVGAGAPLRVVGGDHAAHVVASACTLLADVERTDSGRVRTGQLDDEPPRPRSEFEKVTRLDGLPQPVASGAGGDVGVGGDLLGDFGHGEKAGGGVADRFERDGHRMVDLRVDHGVSW
jgi:hypothetical protein